MKTNLIIVLILIFCIRTSGQENVSVKNLRGCWIQEQNYESREPDESIYLYFLDKTVITFWVYEGDQNTESYSTFYGFYDDCNLPSINSLKDEGVYYFMVDSLDFEDEHFIAKNMENECAVLYLFIEDKDVFINIYYSASQQYVTYKKANRLPEKAYDHLKNKGIVIENK